MSIPVSPYISVQTGNGFASPPSASSLDSSFFPRSQPPRTPIRCRSSNHVGTPVSGPRDSIYAIDQQSTKLKIPLSAVEPTLALEDDGLVPGLCRLFLADRCRQGDRCYQVHANKHVVEVLREEAKRAPSCCPEHGAQCQFDGFPLGLTVTIQGVSTEQPIDPKHGDDDARCVMTEASSNSNGDSNSSNHGERPSVQSTVVSIHSICPTNYLWMTFKESGAANLVVPRSKVCRMHRKGLCRFGDECGFLHVCRELTIDGVGTGDADDDARLSIRTSVSQQPLKGSFVGNVNGSFGVASAHFSQSSSLQHPRHGHSFAASVDGPNQLSAGGVGSHANSLAGGARGNGAGKPSALLMPSEAQAPLLSVLSQPVPSMTGLAQQQQQQQQQEALSPLLPRHSPKTVRHSPTTHNPYSLPSSFQQ